MSEREVQQRVRRGARLGHQGLLFAWRYLPLWARRIAVRVLYPSLPIGAVAVVRDADGRVLLVRQTYHRGGALWGVPGGWLGRGESPHQAAMRETFEETGLRVRAGRVLAADSGPYGEISLAFECRVVGGTAFRPSVETDAARFFPPSALPGMLDDSRRLLEHALIAQDTFPERGSGTAAVPADPSQR
ncbi:MAG: NUDIX domain-containing protein [Chloroflexi bacterium]|nr:NUDIX domain-containing protein [Chloroflexota bacterium]